MSYLTDFFAKKESERGVSVAENEDGTYKIEVRVVPRWGGSGKTGGMIQEAIRDQILSMTGNHASVIDVVIDDIKQESLDRDEGEDTGLALTLNSLTSYACSISRLYRS